jgi:hypothetical protein
LRMHPRTRDDPLWKSHDRPSDQRAIRDRVLRPCVGRPDCFRRNICVTVESLTKSPAAPAVTNSLQQLRFYGKEKLLLANFQMQNYTEDALSDGNRRDCLGHCSQIIEWQIHCEVKWNENVPHEEVLWMDISCRLKWKEFNWLDFGWRDMNCRKRDRGTSVSICLAERSVSLRRKWKR